jgi:hypothetical protein
MATDDTGVYKAALKNARAEFDAATKRLDEIDMEQRKLNTRVAKLKRTITALAAMCGVPGVDSLGITDAVTEVMNDAMGTMTTAEVVKGLDDLGFDLEGQKNAQASAHAILTRLAHTGKIQKIEEEGKTVAWRGPKYDPEWDGMPF